jgi:hypothetical protein
MLNNYACSKALLNNYVCSKALLNNYAYSKALLNNYVCSKALIPKIIPFYCILSDISAVKHPFLRYQLALAVVEETTLVKAKPGSSTDDLLTAEGLGVPDSVFSNLQVSVIYSYI